MQHFAGEDGKQDRVGITHQALKREEQKDGADGAKGADVIPAFSHLFEHAGCGARDLGHIEAHREQRCNDGEVTQAIEQEAPAFAESSYNDAGDGGAEKTRGVGHGGVDGDGVAEVAPVVHHMHEEGLASGHVEGVDQALKSSERDDFRKGYDVRQSQCGESERLDGGERLSPYQQAASIEALDPDSGERPQ